ncbi:M20/M25/M40 family metallo-hydrolase [Streptomyces sp. NPDC060223]|uniref:M20/M25/M40 family metallo-hydrolase n=1 Tax=unclassified Streptomyces TaxID=2593676 RepID=UPI00362510F6
MIFGEIPPPTPDAPTVLLYSHYDVQPPGDEKLWQSPPFEPTPVEGGLRARGIADDKSNVIAHLGMLRAYEGRLSVGVKHLRFVWPLLALLFLLTAASWRPARR